MSQEKYVNHYIEILTTTLQDAIVRNISMQANAKVTEETFQQFVTDNQKLKEQLASQREKEIAKVDELNAQIIALGNRVDIFKSERSDVESMRHQLQHLETFKNQLAATQKENIDLKKQLEDLQPKSKSGKKTKAVAEKVEEVVAVEVVELEPITAPPPAPKVIMSTKDIFKK
jgi:small-conductance mechanosensitive channel